MAAGRGKKVLEPMERLSEVLFGLIMAMTFTTALIATSAGQKDVKVMLAAAIGCNLAWGLIDAIMYLLNTLGDRGALHRIWRQSRSAEDPVKAGKLLAEALPDGLVPLLPAGALEEAAVRLRDYPGPHKVPRLRPEDWRGAFGVFLLVVLATMPVVLPFVFLDTPTTALRVSNLIGVLMLAGIGHAFGQIAGYRPMVTAGAMVLIGLALTAIALALGG
jgi:hypothetical protein